MLPFLGNDRLSAVTTPAGGTVADGYRGGGGELIVKWSGNAPVLTRVAKTQVKGEDVQALKVTVGAGLTDIEPGDVLTLAKAGAVTVLSLSLLAVPLDPFPVLTITTRPA